MNKALTIVLTVVTLGVAITVAYYFGYDHGWEKFGRGQKANQESSDTVSMQYSGKITKNSPGTYEPWYLEYIDGEKNTRTRLGFESNAICSNASKTDNCTNFDLLPDQIVRVTGVIRSDYLAVSSLAVMETGLPPSSSDTFKETLDYGFYGTLVLTGYVDVQQRVCNPGGMCGETVDYVSFVFPTTDNEAIKKFTGSMNGNSFAAGNKLGLGCQRAAENKIAYENDADIGWKVGEIKGSDYTRLMASTPAKPVELKLTREVYTGGRGAPDCYSHFRNFDVI